jgi:hypothetical protein
VALRALFEVRPVGTARIDGGIEGVNVPERLYIPMAVLLCFARIVGTPVVLRLPLSSGFRRG